MDVSAIEAEVDGVVQQSPFLLAAETDEEEPPSISPAIFQRKEVKIGALLGSGSFSKVHEVVGYKLAGSKKKQPSSQSSQWYASLVPSSLSSDVGVVPTLEDTSPQDRDRTEQRRLALSESTLDCGGKSRYAIKFIKKELSKNPRAFNSAAADLILEAKYMAALDHPNILKLRGLATGGSAGFLRGHDGFFVIVDRLQETLADRMLCWEDENPLNDTRRWRQGKLPKDKLLPLKMDYAYQIADALAYLHKRRILFRDLKPMNCGFNSREGHTVQLFDFGLCRELPSDSDSDFEDNEHFHMSGAGTYCYMAPEIFNSKRYNLKADVFSWSIVFHEMIAQRRSFDHYSESEHKEFVCEVGQRPSLTEYNLPESLQTLLSQAWEQDPAQRLTMQEVCRQLMPLVRSSANPDSDESEQSTTGSGVKPGLILSQS
ncbi:Probable LIM domain-containing serine/threonine-protein kinase DDB [Seminavis robusta]|uniref:Probable LIM domain-containing serine/threonine-protein kinase DDB n=1 Tax=Seminavis robusta TaxID=568900 RepID=A0A9N8DWN0_9STRA|nr:Probable LIM domain-containing serine/threonine-protein kinase DDB [Seminavis robusta]|eukprot:Sro421_g139540.1 Probable LIM domain-containing serine/threonine-protein kinase DDB (430) ;mRNA; f:33405-34773